MLSKRCNEQQKCRLKRFYVDLNLCLLALLLSCTYTAHSSSEQDIGGRWVHFSGGQREQGHMPYVHWNHPPFTLWLWGVLWRDPSAKTRMRFHNLLSDHIWSKVLSPVRKCRTLRLLVNFQFGKLQKLADTLPPIQMSESCWWDREQKEIHHPKFSWSQRGAAAIWVAHIMWLSPKCSLFSCVSTDSVSLLGFSGWTLLISSLLHWRCTKMVLLHRTDRRDRQIFWSRYWHASIVLGQTQKNVKLVKTKTFYSFSSKSQIWLKGLQNLYVSLNP